MRKTEMVQIPVNSDSRDKGKLFKITEMPALRAERWAFRALLALAHAGVEMPEDAQGAGMAAIAHAGVKALNKLDFAEARPLLDEMMSCVEIVPDPKNREFTRPLVTNEMEGDDIEELATIFLLRERIFRLHTDFFFKGK